MKRLTRETVKGTEIKNVKLYPNGKRAADWKVSELQTTGIKLIGHQILKMAFSLISMWISGHREVNVNSWLKQNKITFTGTHVYKS